MFNIDETTELKSFYLLQKDLYLRGFLYSLGVFLFIDFKFTEFILFGTFFIFDL
jgi:hypothetical protein